MDDGAGYLPALSEIVAVENSKLVVGDGGLVE